MSSTTGDTVQPLPVCIPTPTPNTVFVPSPLTQSHKTSHSGTDYEGIGIGPWQANPELQRHFPGIEILKKKGREPPRLSTADFIEAVGVCLTKRRGAKGQMDIDDITEVIAERGAESPEELCFFIKKISLGLVIRQVTEVWQENRNVMQHGQRLVARFRAESMNVSSDELQEMDEEIDHSLKNTQGFIDSLTEKAADMLSEGLLEDDVQRLLLTYLLRHSNVYVKNVHLSPLGPVVVCLIMTLAHVEKTICQKCNSFVDQCGKCLRDDPEHFASVFGAQLTSHNKKEDTVSVVFDVSDVCDYAAAVLAEAVRMQAEGAPPSAVKKLHNIELLVCERAGVAGFSEMGVGSFLEFFSKQASEIISKHSIQDPAVLSLIHAKTTSSDSTFTKPELADILDTIVSKLADKGPFVQSWGLLNSLEASVPEHYGKERWHEICETSFTRFMARNTSTLHKKGFVLVGTPSASSTRLSKLIPKELGALSENNADDWACCHFRTTKGFDEVFSSTPECINAEVGVDRKTSLNEVFTFSPKIGANVDKGNTLAEENAAFFDRIAATSRAFDPSLLQIIKEAALQPNGIDLCSLTLYNELYREGSDGKETSFGEFVVTHHEALQADGVRILVSADRPFEEPKYYAVNTTADASGVESATARKCFAEAAVLIWSLLATSDLKDLEEGGVDSPLHKIITALRESFATADGIHMLGSVVLELLLATPTTMTRYVFEELYIPILTEVDPNWETTCAPLLCNHPEKARLMQRGLQLNTGNTIWMETYRKSLDTFPQHKMVHVVQKKGAEKVVEKIVHKAIEPPTEDMSEAVEEEVVRVEGVTPEQQYLEEIRETMCAGGNTALTSMMKKALGVIADQLYESDFHFFFELVQNADDNTYPPHVEPALRFQLDTNCVEILNNEVGFTRSNVRAVCKVNESTKLGTDSIGRKGIGFKAVFSVTDHPHITSNGFNFSFDRNACDLGLVMPVIERKTPIPSHGELVTYAKGVELQGDQWVTRLALPFKECYVGNADFYESCGSGADCVQSLLLLFLKRLRRVEVENRLRDVRRVLVRTDSAVDPAVALKVQDATLSLRSLSQTVGAQAAKKDTFIVFEKTLHITDQPALEARFGADTADEVATSVQVAFLAVEGDDVTTNIEGNPATAGNTAVDVFPMTAYLPTNTKLFRFVLQADWTVNAARDRVSESHYWNRALREEVPAVILEAFEVIVQCVSAGRLVADYVYQMVPSDPPRGDWMRATIHTIHSKLRHFPCVQVLQDGAGTIAWEEPANVLLLPEGLAGELVRHLVSPADLQTFLQKHFVDPTVLCVEGRQHRDMLKKNLGVSEFSGDMLMEVLERMHTAGRIPLDYSWITQAIACLKLLLPTAVDQVQPYMQRFRRLKLIPVLITDAKQDDAPSALSSIDDGDLYITRGEGYAFFRYLRIVDPLLWERKSETEDRAFMQGVRAFLIKVGVKSSGAVDILESLERLFKTWEAGADDVTLDDVRSCAMWLEDNSARLLGSVPERFAAVAASLPVACTTIPKKALDLHVKHSVDPTRAVVRCCKDYIIVRPECVDVLHAQRRSTVVSELAADVQFLTAHSAYNEKRYPEGALSRAGLVHGLVKLRRVRSSKSEAWVERYRSVQEANAAVCVDLPGMSAALPLWATTAPLLLKDDTVAPNLAVLFEVMGDVDHWSTRPERAQLMFAEFVCELLSDPLYKDSYFTKLSYVPDLTAVEGKVSTEDDRRLSTTGYPSSLHLLLASHRWVLNAAGKLHHPNTLFFATQDVEQYLGDTKDIVWRFDAAVANKLTRQRLAVPQEADVGQLLALLGVQSEVTAARLVHELQTWMKRDEFTSSGEHMTRVLKRVGGKNFAKIWVPSDRRPPDQGNEAQPVKGFWYKPDECFVKGGVDAFLDWASSNLRFVGFVYKRCGHELGDAGVQQFAPWEDQVRCLATIAKNRLKLEKYSRGRNDIMELISKHLEDILVYKDEITEAGLDALKTSDIWYTTGRAFASTSKTTVLFNDLATPSENMLKKLPKKFCVLDHNFDVALRPFLETLGMRPLSSVVVETRKAPEATLTWSERTVYDYSWRALIRELDSILAELEDPDLVAAVAAENVLSADLAVKYVEYITIGHAIEGGEHLDGELASFPHYYEAGKQVFSLATTEGGKPLGYAGVLRRFGEGLFAVLPCLAEHRVLRDSFEDSIAKLVGLHFNAEDETLSDEAAARFVTSAPLPILAKVFSHHHDVIADVPGVVPLLDPRDIRIISDIPQAVDETEHLYGWITEQLAAHTASGITKDLPAEISTAFSAFFTSFSFAHRPELCVQERGLAGDFRLGHKVRHSGVDLQGKVCRFATPNSAQDTADMVGAILEDAMQYVFTEMDVNSVVSYVQQYLKADEARLEAVVSAKDACLNTLSEGTTLKDVVFDVKKLATTVGATSFATIPKQYLRHYENEAEAIAERKKQVKEKRERERQQDEEKKQARAERPKNTYDPSNAATSFGRHSARPGGDSHGDVTAEMVEAAKERRKNWPEFEIPADKSFHHSADFMGPKEGFAFENGPEGMGYYREGAAVAPIPKCVDAIPTAILPDSSDEESDTPQTSPTPIVTEAMPAEARQFQPRTQERDSTFIRLDPYKHEDSGSGRMGEEQIFKYITKELETATPIEGDSRNWNDPNRKLINWVNAEGESYMPCDITRGVPADVFAAALRYPKDEQGSVLLALVRDYPWLEVIEVKTARQNKLVLEVSPRELEMAQILKERFVLYHLSRTASEAPLLRRVCAEGKMGLYFRYDCV